MSPILSVALCGLPSAIADRIRTWLEQQGGTDLRIAFAAASPGELLERMASQPVHGVLLDAGLGLEGISFAQELLQAGYRAVCLAGTAERQHLRLRAAEAGLHTCPDYEPARLITALRQLLGLESGAAAAGLVIAAHSLRGGAGATSLLLHLARRLNQQGQSVALVEVSGCGGAVPLLGLRPEGGWSALLPAPGPGLATHPEGLALLSQALVEVAPGLHLLPSGGPVRMDQLGADEVEAVLQLLPACGIDTILVDGAPELTLPTAAALAAAHRVCPIALPDPVSAFRLVQSQEALAGLQIPAARIRPIINRAREGVPTQLQEAMKFLGYPPPLCVPEESKPPVDAGGRFAGFRPGGGADRALESLLQELSPTSEVRTP
ncbi:MAG: AAA family ATPase [Bacillota bacterium]